MKHSFSVKQQDKIHKHSENSCVNTFN